MKTTIFALICAGVGIVLGIGLARVQLGEATPFVLPDSSETIASGDATTPQVSVDSETHDFGSMERDATKSHEFRFTNTGNAPLELTVGETTCKCTIGETPQRRVEPGESVPVKLVWTANTDEPHFRQHAEIHTNDPLRQTVNLTIVGKVTDVSSFFPRTLVFGDVPTGTPRSAELKIVSFRDESFEILEHEFVAPASDEHFTVQIEELPPDEYPTPEVLSGRRVKVTAEPTLPFGPIGGWLRVKTNLDTVPQLEVPLTGKVVSDLTVFGPDYNDMKDMLRLGPVVASQGAERKLIVFLRGDRGKGVELRVGETDPSFLQAELGERKAISDNVVQVPLMIRVPQGSPPGVHMNRQDSRPGRIILHTTHPQVPEINIQVEFTVQ
jgi:hypothetical protein